MSDFVMPLLLNLDAASLAMSLVNIASPRGEPSALADSVEAALRTVAHLDVERSGDTVVARTTAARSADHVAVVARLDTAATDDDPLAYVEMGRLFGPGASDAKGALAMALKVAATGGSTRHVTFVFSDGTHPVDHAIAEVDFVVRAEPTDCVVLGDASDHPDARRLIELSDAPAGTRAVGSATAPGVAFGPGDPSVAGTPGEFVPTAQLTQSEFVLRQWLTAPD